MRRDKSVLAVMMLLILGVSLASMALPKPSFGGCISWDGRYLLTVTNRGDAGYIGYDIYGNPPGDPGGIQDLGLFNADEVKQVYLDVPAGTSWTLRKFVKENLGDAWQQKGGTHVASLSKPSADSCCWSIVGCPEDMTVEANTPVAWIEPMVQSSCCGLIAATTQSHAPGAVFPVGVTTVTYTWTSPDPAVYTKSCSFTITAVEPIELIGSPDPERFVYRQPPAPLGGGGGETEDVPLGELEISATYVVGEIIEGCAAVVQGDVPVDLPYLNLSFYAADLLEAIPFDDRAPLFAKALRYSAETGGYCYGIETKDLDPGLYDLRIGIPSGDFEWVRIELLPAAG
jgi:hypothetical protein